MKTILITSIILEYLYYPQSVLEVTLQVQKYAIISDFLQKQLIEVEFLDFFWLDRYQNYFGYNFTHIVFEIQLHHTLFTGHSSLFFKFIYKTESTWNWFNFPYHTRKVIVYPFSLLNQSLVPLILGSFPSPP